MLLPIEAEVNLGWSGTAERLVDQQLPSHRSFRRLRVFWRLGCFGGSRALAEQEFCSTVVGSDRLSVQPHGVWGYLFPLGAVDSTSVDSLQSVRPSQLLAPKFRACGQPLAALLSARSKRAGGRPGSRTFLSFNSSTVADCERNALDRNLWKGLSEVGIGPI